MADSGLPSSYRAAWWECEDPEPTLTAYARDLRSRDEPRRICYRVYDDLYDGRSLYSVENVEAMTAIGRAAGLQARTLNFARTAADFVHSKVTSETPTVRAAGHGADWDQHLKARRLSKFVAGVHDSLDLDTQLPVSCLTALRTGTGVTVVDRRRGRPTIAVVSPREFFVDADDGRHGDPRCLYRIHPVDRRTVADEYPDLADRIMAVGATSDTTIGLYDPWYAGYVSVDAIDRYEGWYLPGHDDDGNAIPGRHVVAIEGTLLLDEDWDCPRFPVAFLRMGDHRPGSTFWGQGLMERLDGIQCEIDDAVAHIGRGIRENNLKIFIDDTSDISPDVIADPTVGTIIKMAPGGRPPEFQVPQGASAQEIQWLKELVNWLYQMAGMDEGAASSQRPAGINSGRAILYFHDFQSQRYVDLSKRYGRHVVDVIERVLDACRMLSEDEPSWTVRYAKGSVVRDIDFRDVDMDADAYVLELEEISPVPDTFAGRVQQIEQDAAEGRIPPEYLARLREDPDTWWIARRSSRADVDYIEWLVDELLDPDRPVPPISDEVDQALLIDALRTEVLNATVAGAGAETVARLQGYAARVVAAQQPPTPPPPQVPPPTGGGQPPGGAPPPPPPAQ